MSNKSIGLSDDLQQYILGHSSPEPEILVALRAETALMEDHAMQIAPEQGQFMGLLARLIGAKRTLEIGTFTGYSALAMALALGDGGEVVTLDMNEEYTNVARKYWDRAGVSDRVHLHLAPALETLTGALGSGHDGGHAGGHTGGHNGSFDMAFIDADKENYISYFDHCLRLVRPGGVILVDNVLWDGRVVDPDIMTETTQAIRAVNKHIVSQPQVEVVMAPIGDGLSLVRKI